MVTLPYGEIVGKQRGLGAGRTYSLLGHSLDTGIVARILFRLALSGAQRQAVARALGVSVDSAEKLVVLAAAWHDIGKATVSFASVIPGQPMAVKACCGEHDAAARIRHETSGGYHVLDWMRRKHGSVSPGMFALVMAIAGHHGTFPDWTTRAKPDTVERDGMGGQHQAAWSNVRDTLMEHVATTLVGAQWDEEFATAAGGTGAEINAALPIISRVVVQADWIVSGASIGGGSPDPARLDAWLPGREDFLTREVRRHGAVGERFGPRPFTTHFPHFKEGPRGVQRLIVEHLADLGPGMVVVLDATGNGKEAACLHGAAILAQHDETVGFAVLKPTRATATAEYPDVAEFCRNAFDEPATLVLKHSSSRDVTLYTDTMRIDNASAPRAANDGPACAVQTTRWLMESRKGLMSPNLLGTIDQALRGVIAGIHSATMLGAITGKTIVIDEAHSYDAHMQAELCRLIEWIAAMRQSVILSSATLPLALLNGLVTAFKAGLGVPEGPPSDLPSDVPYPGIVHVGMDGTITMICARDQQPQLPATLSVTDYESEPDVEGHAEAYASAVVRVIRETFAGSEAGFGNVAVFANDITTAIRTFHRIQRAFPDVPAIVLHSALSRSERLNREAMLKSRYGRDAAQRPERSIVVMTQVGEQSLNVDFDHMISDLAPVPWILQRLGRLGRFASTRRPAGWTRSMTVLSARIDGRFGAPERRPYDRITLMAADRVLRRAARIELPGSVQGLVEEGHRLAASAWNVDQELAERSQKAAHLRVVGQVRRADGKIIPSPHAVVTYAQLTDGEPDVSARDEMNVRSLLPVWRDASGALRFIGPTGPLVPPGRPSRHERQALEGAVIDKSVAPSWVDQVTAASAAIRPAGWDSIIGLDDILLVEMAASSNEHDAPSRAQFGTCHLRLRESSGLESVVRIDQE